MSEIVPLNWLEHHSGRIAQDCAVRLCLACSAVVPSDRKLRALVEEQIKSDLLQFAFNARRLMEIANNTQATITTDPLWPASSVVSPSGNLMDALGKIIHARSICVGWEKVDLSPNPYSGREPQFAGSVTVLSDGGKVAFAIGALAASFLSNVLSNHENELPSMGNP